jgi:hypothetical protein
VKHVSDEIYDSVGATLEQLNGSFLVDDELSAAQTTTCRTFPQFASRGRRFDPGHVHQLNSRSLLNLRCNLYGFVVRFLENCFCIWLPKWPVRIARRLATFAGSFDGVEHIIGHINATRSLLSSRPDALNSCPEFTRGSGGQGNPISAMRHRTTTPTFATGLLPSTGPRQSAAVEQDAIGSEDGARTAGASGGTRGRQREIGRVHEYIVGL